MADAFLRRVLYRIPTKVRPRWWLLECGHTVEIPRGRAAPKVGDRHVCETCARIQYLGQPGAI